MKKLLLIPVVFALALAACGAPSEQDKILQVQEYTQIMKGDKDAPDPIHGKETSFYYGAVSGTEGTNANGLAYIRVYEDGTSSVTVNLNIALPPDGTHYIAYVQSSAGDTSIKVGELTSIVGDVRHTVKLETKEDASKTLSVKVRREGKGQSDLVAEGTMKQPAPPQ
ncbi:MAG: hypothetical protein KBA40_01530 [Candidatus Peribacteraceae bacterium]|nr:hypothetical protein [Candidatus Peribacteraceae bacterium]MBP9850732.1 hypothetical protein [Candidatus Peribacteraceae bacterium]